MAVSQPARRSSLIDKLAKPTPAYQRRAWLAVGGLLLFVALYFALAGWFALTAYRLTLGADAGGHDGFWGWVIGACAAFLAVFMLKAIFFVKHGGMDDTVEITPAEQPLLFEFLHRLADKAGAPRPHKVFISPRVNAAVFYDLSILNLFFPSKKNLEIGLGLVNALTLGELRAVLAHEFGHFAQRAMAVGRWVYIAQQIAGHLVARRDKLDGFLRGLSRFDLRVAWVGWVLSLVVWSIRSLVDSAFQVVMLMQRALSREMEMNADLVAVSLTGSDALIHALHRLQSADDAWSRTLSFVGGEKANGRVTRDVFIIQSEILGRMGRILNDEGYGRVPPLPAERPESHRLFKPELAQPPQMWLTHPLNHEREANAKRHYVAAPIDDRSAWAAFESPESLREKVSAKLLGKVESAPVADEASLEALAKQFEREYLASRYRGVYLARSAVRCAARVDELYDPDPADALAAAQQLYPATLADDVEQLRTLAKELGQLRALDAGALNATGGVLRHRGKTVTPRELPHLVASVEREMRATEARLNAHDRQCRSVHRAAACVLGEGWPEYLHGLLAALHYGDHSEANLRDAQGLLVNAVNIATATRRVSSAGRGRVVAAANALYRVLAKLFGHRAQVLLDASLLECMAVPSWAEAMGELKLPPASEQNIGEWLDAANGWVDHAAGLSGLLRARALEQLLRAEAQVLQHLQAGTSPGAAPAPSSVPADADTLLPGGERQRQTRLDWWGRFQTADGLLPAAARLLVAGGIVGAVLGLGGTVGSTTVTIYNGLARPVVVQLGTSSVQLAPGTSQSRSVDAGRDLKVSARTVQGQLIEQFDGEVRGSFGNLVYNVAGASPLVQWTAVYGNAAPPPERMLGAPRWTPNTAETMFAEPPQQISTKSGGGTREVLSGFADGLPQQQTSLLASEAERRRLIAAHARWDPADSPNVLVWLALSGEQADYPAIAAARLHDAPGELIVLRMEQDRSSGSAHDDVCARQQASALAAPRNADLAYLAARCVSDPAARREAFSAARRRWPDHGWLAYAVGASQAETAHWSEALVALDQARHQVPALAGAVAVDMARIRRLLDQDARSGLADLARGSAQLRLMLGLESGEGLDAPDLKAYAELSRGRLQGALQVAHRDAEREARIVRLAAASDGASPELVARALALPAGRGIDSSTVWPSIALALRAQHDAAPFEPALRSTPEEHRKPLLRFVDALRHGQDLTVAERLLDGLPPELRGQGYSMAVVLLGSRAPVAWRDAAKRLLFVSERPYFS